MNRTAQILIGAAIGTLIVLGILGAMGDLETAEDDSDIPSPPPGYQWCVDNSGQILGFCREGDR